MSTYSINYELHQLRDVTNQKTQVFESNVSQPSNHKLVKIGYLPAYKLFKTTKFNGPTPVDCCICLNKIKKDNTIVIMEQCGHMYHKACLFNWVDLSKKTFCPYCRQDIF